MTITVAKTKAGAAMHLVGRNVPDRRLLRLIGDMLRAPMRLSNGREEPRRQGTPQGGPLSPLLANIYLHPLDLELEKRGLSFVRYAGPWETATT